MILPLTLLTAKVDQDVLPVEELHRRLLLVVTTTMNKRLSNEVVESVKISRYFSSRLGGDVNYSANVLLYVHYMSI